MSKKEAMAVAVDLLNMFDGKLSIAVLFSYAWGLDAAGFCASWKDYLAGANHESIAKRQHCIDAVSAIVLAYHDEVTSFIRSQGKGGERV